MAVWIQIIGLRKLASNQIEKERVASILNSIEFDFNSILPEYDIRLSQPQWKLRQSKDIEFFELQLLNQSLKIYFDNANFIEFSGSFDWFGSHFWFVDKQNADLTKSIRNVFLKIANEYGISELIYFSEWFFDLNEIRTGEETFKGLKNRIKESSEYQKKELEGMEANEYYIEKIV